MGRTRVLLSEGSSLTAREFVTVLGGSAQIEIEVATATRLPIARFSRWCHRVHRVPSPALDPWGYLRAVEGLVAARGFDAVLPTHEQAWLFGAAADLVELPVAVAPLAAFDRVVSKVAFAQVMDDLQLAQPPWTRITAADDLTALGFPVWVKSAFSTAGRGVRLVTDPTQALRAWQLLGADEDGQVMIQQPAAGTYAQVQGLFDDGRLIASTTSELVAQGVGGSAAARRSVEHPAAVDALTRLGEHLRWHGGLGLDYLHQGGVPQFIECNPRITEPANGAAAGVDLPQLMIHLSRGRGPSPISQRSLRPGVVTRSGLALALGSAERCGTRRSIAGTAWQAVRSRPPLQGSREVLTPVRRDPPSLLPFLVGAGRVLLRPGSVAHIAESATRAYAVPPSAIDVIRGMRNQRPA